MDQKPEFITRDVSAIQSDLKAEYEAISGRPVFLGQSENLLLNAIAYRESLLRQAIQEAALQNLVAFSSAPVLDYLGELVGVTRLPAKTATALIRFSLVPGHNGIVIPAGLRVESKDGAVNFATNYPQGVAAGVNTIDVECDCSEVGLKGNGYLPSEISNILDPQAYITGATNPAITAGGAEAEVDDQLRVRIKQAPASYSNAGSKGSYIFHAKSANPSIIDVAVTSPLAGTVKIFPLVRGGIVTPAEVLADVAAVCSGDKVRPLTDTVLVEAPARVDYALTVNLTLYPTAVQADVLAAVEANLQAFTEAKAALLGQDVILTQVLPSCMVQGVYKADLAGFTDLVVGETEYAFCTGITVTVTGLNNG